MTDREVESADPHLVPLYASPVGRAPEPDVKALDAAVRALERHSTSPKMLRANVEYLYDRYVRNPTERAPHSPGGTDE